MVPGIIQSPEPTATASSVNRLNPGGTLGSLGGGCGTKRSPAILSSASNATMTLTRDFSNWQPIVTSEMPAAGVVTSLLTTD
jgi:hypothetical protein